MKKKDRLTPKKKHEKKPKLPTKMTSYPFNTRHEQFVLSPEGMEQFSIFRDPAGVGRLLSVAEVIATSTQPIKIELLLTLGLTEKLLMVYLYHPLSGTGPLEPRLYCLDEEQQKCTELLMRVTNLNDKESAMVYLTYTC